MTVESRIIRLLMELRASGILDTRVLAAIERIPREMFVSQPFIAQAYDNIALPIEDGQTISQPYLVAFMLQALEIDPKMRVLEVGTGSGYQAAVLSKICRRVYSIERIDALRRQAEQRFAALNIRNITTMTGNGFLGWPQQAPFQRVVVAAAAPECPQPLLDQLADDGRLIMPIGMSDDQQVLTLFHRRGNDIHTTAHMPVRFVPLLNDHASKSPPWRQNSVASHVK